MDLTITTLEELTKILRNPDYDGKPLLIDVNVIENENCYPMVAPGKVIHRCLVCKIKQYNNGPNRI